MNAQTMTPYTRSPDNSEAMHCFANSTRTTCPPEGPEILFQLDECRLKSGALTIDYQTTLTPAAVEQLLEVLAVAVEQYQQSLGPPKNPHRPKFSLPPDTEARIRMLAEMHHRAE